MGNRKQGQERHGGYPEDHLVWRKEGLLASLSIRDSHKGHSRAIEESGDAPAHRILQRLRPLPGKLHCLLAGDRHFMIVGRSETEYRVRSGRAGEDSESGEIAPPAETSIVAEERQTATENMPGE
ncbi:hypothetical protein MRX96_008753 [Rhipicephalus microplus]